MIHRINNNDDNLMSTVNSSGFKYNELLQSKLSGTCDTAAVNNAMTETVTLVL